MVVALACKEARVVERAVIAVAQPQMSATVITIQTVLRPQNRTFIHSIVIAEGRARSSDEVDRWRLYDLDNDRVTFVDDLARTYFTKSIAQLSVVHDDRTQTTATGAKRVIDGVEATQYLIRLGAYQRELWLGTPEAIPPKLFGMMNATDEDLANLEGFPMIDHAELPYGNSRMVVDRSVLKIEQRKVPQSSLSVPADYTEITTPGARRPPASSPPPGRNTRGAE